MLAKSLHLDNLHEMGTCQYLLYFILGDEYPFTSYFDVQQEYMLLTHTQIQHIFEIYGSADFFNHVFVMSATPYPFLYGKPNAINLPFGDGFNPTHQHEHFEDSSLLGLLH